MKFTEAKDIKKGQGTWTIVIDGQEWTDAQKKAKNRLKESLEIPGFRKGKAPVNEIEKYLTPVKIYNEAFRIMVSPAFEFAQNQKPTIEIITSPDPKIKKVDTNSMTVEFVFDLRPEITLGKYTGINTVEKQKPEISDQEIEQTVMQYQNQFAMESIKPNDAKIEKNDIVKFDFKGYIDGVAFKGGEAKDFSLQIGSNQFVPGFEDSMIGLGIGDDQEINITFPTDYTPEYAGKDAKFVLNITEIKSRSLPAKDDEFAKDLNMPEIKTYADLEAKIKVDLLKNKEQNLRNDFVNKIIGEVIKTSTISLAPSTIKTEIANLKNEFEAQVKQQGLTLKDYKKATGMTDAQIEKELEGDAIAKLQNWLVASEIIKVEKFEVSEEAISNKLEQLAIQFGMKADDLRGMVQNDMLKNEIINEMLTDHIYNNNGK